MVLKLIFFTGHAGTGKTTLAKEIAKRKKATFLDMDTVSNRFVETLLKNAGLDVKDRDSVYFKENCRDIAYQSTFDIAIENLKLKQDVFLVAPFTKELKTKGFVEKLLLENGIAPEEVSVKVVRVFIGDYQIQKERIVKRATKRDSYKLAHWEKFESNLKNLEKEKWLDWDIEKKDVLLFDNSGSLDENKIREVINFIE